MEINRNNYEEYFLSYIDGELTASEQQAVESFVQQNADLEGELNLLLQTKLNCDTTALPNKESLYRHTDCTIVEADYEEKFLLYIDNELDEDGRKEVEIFLQQNPGKQQQFEALQKTILVPEKIVFANKNVLYKKRKPAVLFITWTRIAVAAAFIGLCIGTWNLLPSNSKKVKNTITENSKVSKITKSIPEVAVVPSQKQQVTVTGNAIVKINTKVIPSKRISSSSPIQHDNVKIKEEKPSLPMNEKETTLVMANPENNTKDKPDFDLLNSQQSIILSNNVENEPKKLLQKTIYKELDTEETTTNNNIYVVNFQINKNKLAGLLKRASHLFNKPSDTENSIAIANFTINKSLR